MRSGPTARRALLGMAVALMLPLAACGSDDSGSASSAGSSSSSSSSSGSGPVVRLQGLSSGLSGVAIKTIQIQGLDKKHGFTGEYQFLPPDSATQNFLLGKSDVDFDVGPPDLAVAASKDYDVVSFTSAVKNHVSVIAPADSEFTTMESLKGHKIGWFGADSTAALTLAMLLNDEGINFFKDYKFAQAAPPALVPLLKSGQVDAIVTFEPWTSWARSQIEGGIKTIYNPGDAWHKTHPDGDIWTTIGAAQRDWIKQNTELAQDVEDAWCEAADYMNNHMAELVKNPEIEKLLEPVSPEGLEAMAKTVSEQKLFQCGWSAAGAKDVNAFLDAMAKQGTLFKKNPGNLIEPLSKAAG